jgi:hypothetical protein
MMTWLTQAHRHYCVLEKAGSFDYSQTSQMKFNTLSLKGQLVTTKEILWQ